MPRTVAITGATGFIGRTLARQAASAGWRIRALVRPESVHRRPEDLPLEWVTGSLEDMESLRHLVDGADAVVHCAGAVRCATHEKCHRTNAHGTARIARAAHEQRRKPHFVLLSSLASRQPRLSWYAASKRAGETALADHAGRMPWVVFRPPAVYGPGDREMLPLFRWMTRGIAPVTGSDQNRVSLLYVADLAEAILCWLERGTPVHCNYELHDGQPGGYSWQDIIDTVSRVSRRPIHRINIPVPALRLVAGANLRAARILGRSPMLTPGKVRELLFADWVADNTALHRDTGWTPQTTLADGLRQTLCL